MLAGELDAIATEVIVIREHEWRDGRLLRYLLTGNKDNPQLHWAAEALPAELPSTWQITRIQGLNLARFSWVELIVLTRSSEEEPLPVPVS